MVFIEETWNKATNILDTYNLPIDVDIKVRSILEKVEELNDEVNGGSV